MFFHFLRVKSEDRNITVKPEPRPLADKTKAKKRKIAETSNVITETLPSVEAESEQVEIEVEVGEEAIVQECLMEEEVTDGGRETDDSALALLADITSKYQQGASNVKRAREEVGDLQEEAVMATKTLEGIEVVEVQISDNMFRCDKCERCFKLFYHLKQHMKTHTASSEKPFVCKHCGKTYAREGALKQHVNTCHYDAEELSKKLKKKVHMCVYCSKEFDHFGHFKEHLRKHTGTSTTCAQCTPPLECTIATSSLISIGFGTRARRPCGRVLNRNAYTACVIFLVCQVQHALRSTALHFSPQVRNLSNVRIATNGLPGTAR